MEESVDRSVEIYDKRKIIITLKMKTEYNYLTYQCDSYYKKNTKNKKNTPYALIEEIIIENCGNEEFRDALICFETSNSILEISDIYIANILPNSKTVISQGIFLKVDALALYQITESIPLNISLKLIYKGEQLQQLTDDVILFPINESNEIANNHELLACFVTPNADLVKEVTFNAIKNLSQIRNGQSAFIGYQANDIDSVREEMKAIYDALKALNINYANPPSSYNLFQRVRLPESVIAEKLGTCLDLAILYAACLENVGLKPILILIKGHAFTGCFLEDNCFPERVCTDPSKIYNHSAVGNMDIELVECTMFTASTQGSFNDATKEARKKLYLYTDVFSAIDIFSSHLGIFRPIPTKKIDASGNIIIDAEIMIEEELVKKNTPNNKKQYLEEETNNKFNYWSKKLLDLSLKNKLINFKPSASAIQIEYHDGIKLFDKLLKEDSIYLFPYADDNFEKSVKEEDISLYNGYARNNIYKILATDKPLKNLFRAGNSSIEETGSNCLYLSIGQITYQPKNSKKAMFAPIFLIPVRGKNKKTQNGFELLIDDDNISINTTIFEYLNQTYNINFNELYNVDKNIHNIDLKTIFNTIRDKTCGECSIAVDEDIIYLTTFSFANYIIWEDIHSRKEQLLENEIIQSLVEQRSLNASEDVPLNLDLDVEPDDIAIPLPADSSQIKAIIDCASGKSFVLDGPPGTGKSQTIVNMIVNSLYNGKSVLFVAEKMAALEVVKKRIDDINLGYFCLELHSNKASKRLVLEQIDKALKHDHTASSSIFKKSSQELFERRNELNEFINKIYEEKLIYSLHDAIVYYEDVKEYDLKISNSNNFHLLTNINDLNKISEITSDLIALKEQYGEYYESLFSSFKLTDYVFTSQKRFSELLGNLYQSITSLKGKLNELSKITKLPIDENRNNIETYLKVIEIILTKKVSFNTLYTNEINTYHNVNLKVLNKGIINNQIENKLNNIFITDFKTVDELTLLNEYEQKRSSRIKIFFFNFKIKKYFKSLLKEKLNYKLADYIDILKQIKTYKENMAFINQNGHYLEKLLGDKYVEMTNNFELMKEYYENSIKVKELLKSFNTNIDTDDFIINLLDSFNKLLNEVINNELTLFKLSKVNEAYYNLKQEEAILNTEFLYDPYLAVAIDDTEWINNYEIKVSSMIENASEIEGIALYNQLLNRLNSLNVPETLIKMYKDGDILVENLNQHYKASLYYELISEYFKDQYFIKFTGILFDQAIKKYNELLDDYTALVILETASKITKDYPLQNFEYAKSSQIYNLKRCIKNNGHKTTIRNILTEFGTLIRKICPCFLMSPTSAAQYLSLNQEKFDVVIFDEASQIPTCEAIGAISRGNALVVAGDPCQMPPTSFFQTNFSSDEITLVASNYEDLESLLDDCLALGMRRNRLLWHYRSEHESLISFSNNAFYENSLYTFPSPDNSFKKVKFYYQEKGIYDNGINMQEADAILKEVERRFNDPVLKHQTIGIVTFNMKQQEIILERVNELLENNPAYLELNEHNKDKIFVKNLENVQGDERDIIMFSVGFGYNDKGKFNLFFGPLSLEKGERRLNVAVTRARKEMLVFSSIKGGDINTSKTKNLGATILKQFLLYAEVGSSSIIVENSEQIIIKKGIEVSIKEELEKLGIDSDINIGDSKFRINVGIKDKHGRYILGVICDGGTNNQTSTCRDRNQVQIKMLQRLNWHIINVYSVDYIKNKKAVLDYIVKSISNYQPLIEIADNKLDIKFEKNQVDGYKRSKDYLKHLPIIKLSYENLIENYKYQILVDALTSVIDNEGPIAYTLLLERFKEMLKITKAGVRVKRIFDYTLKFVVRNKKRELSKIIYFPNQVTESDINYYRLSESDERDLLEIPACEIKNAMLDILELQGQILRTEVARILGTFFGKKVVTATTLEKLDTLVEYVINNSNLFIVKDHCLILNDDN